MTTGSNPEGIRDDVREVAEHARSAARKSVQYARDSARHAYDESRRRVDECETRVEDYVRAHPLKSVLIASGIGALLGMFMFRR